MRQFASPSRANSRPGPYEWRTSFRIQRQRRNPRARRKRGLGMYTRAYKASVAIPPLLWVTVFLLVPYAILFCCSFWSVSPLQVIVHNWNLQNYAQLVRNPIYLSVLFRSMRIAATVTLLA